MKTTSKFLSPFWQHTPANLKSLFLNLTLSCKDFHHMCSFYHQTNQTGYYHRHPIVLLNDLLSSFVCYGAMSYLVKYSANVHLILFQMMHRSQTSKALFQFFVKDLLRMIFKHQFLNHFGICLFFSSINKLISLQDI